jgi:hypothetical protein
LPDEFDKGIKNLIRAWKYKAFGEKVESVG